MAPVYVLYGPLAQAPIVSLLLPEVTLRPEPIMDHQMVALDGELAALRAAPGHQVAGLRLPDDLSAQVMECLNYVLDLFGFEWKTLGVGGIQVPWCSDVSMGAPIFEPDPWLADGAVRLERMMLDILAHRHRYSAAQMAQRLMPMRMRAAAWQAARNRPGDPGRNIDDDVIVHRDKRPYMNFFAAQEMDLQFRKQDGSLSDVVNRGALMMSEAVIVLPYDPKRDAVLLIEQFRAPLYIGGSRAPWTWEPVAGLIDPGETAEQAAHREAAEEAGLTLRHLIETSQAYSSTGALSDYLYLYIGIADFDQRKAASGLAEEGEDITSQILPFETLMAEVDAGGYVDLPLYMLALWLARHRDRVRAMA